MIFDYLVFDLDGTLSDPKEGITKSINYALIKHGYEAQCIDVLAPLVIGPPLDESFRALTKVTDSAHIGSLVTSYRERYADLGYRENILYDGIDEALGVLKDRGVKMGVCTSKPERFARPILQMFDLIDYFDFVSGGDVGVKKGMQLRMLLEQKAITQNSLMIGDRAVDMIAARENNLCCAGVLWGYGSNAELSEQNPDHLLNRVEEFKIL